MLAVDASQRTLALHSNSIAEFQEMRVRVSAVLLNQVSERQAHRGISLLRPSVSKVRCQSETNYDYRPDDPGNAVSTNTRTEKSYFETLRFCHDNLHRRASARVGALRFELDGTFAFMSNDGCFEIKRCCDFR
jgi:hypothetical protein